MKQNPLKTYRMENEEVQYTYVAAFIMAVTSKRWDRTNGDFIQTVDAICCSHWTEAVHEVAHWLAADPGCRGLDNLGLPKDDTGTDVWEEMSEVRRRMYREEVVALAMTKPMCAAFGCDDRVGSYVDYLDEGRTVLCKKFGLDEGWARQRASQLLAGIAGILEEYAGLASGQ